jgi:hypothetical protein
MSLRVFALAVATLASVIAVSSALAGGPDKSFTVTSSLDGKSVLPLRIRWIAAPQIPVAQVREVDYLIDGRKAWVEHHAPYYYGANDGNYGNWLVTSFLSPGMHTFTVRAVAQKGGTATDTTRARVIAAPPPPAKLAGTWTRVVTPADLKKGPKGPPPGRWTLHITSVGWGWSARDRWDVRYLPEGNIVMGPEIDTPAEQAGGFCGVDTLFTWTVRAATDDRTMELDPVGHDTCGDRVAVLQGVWTRVK